MPKLLAMQQLVADYDSDHPGWVVNAFQDIHRRTR
jgi:hypothetical protein